MFRSCLSYIFSVVDSFTRVPALLSGKLLGNNCCVLVIVVVVNNGATAHKRSNIQSNPLRCEKIPMQFECQIHTHPQTLSLFMVDCLTGVSDGREEHEGGLIKSDTKGPPQYCAKQPSTIERVILLLN